MLKLLFELISAIWEILLRIPMPWRSGLVCLLFFTFTYWLIWRFSPWLVTNLFKLFLLFIQGVISTFLLVEYVINRRLRREGRNPLPGSYAFGDFLENIGSIAHIASTKLTNLLAKKKSSRKSWLLVIILLAVLPIIFWYSRPYLADTKFGSYIDKSIICWNSLEGWALTGNWISNKEAAIRVESNTNSHAISPEPRVTKIQSTPNYAIVEIRSIPSGARVTINDIEKGITPLTYLATPKEILKIRFEAPAFDILEIERVAPSLGAMTIIENYLVPKNFPNGKWSGQISGKHAELELRKGEIGYFHGVLIFKRDENETEFKIALRGRYNPVQRILLLNEINNDNSSGKLSVLLSDDFRNMRGEWRPDTDSSTVPFDIYWQESDD